MSSYCTGCVVDLEVTRLRQQLAECQVREKVLRDALEKIAEIDLNNSWSRQSGMAKEALALLSDSTALDTMLKAAKREALLDMAVAVKEMGVFNYSVESIADEIHNRAKELE